MEVACGLRRVHVEIRDNTTIHVIALCRSPTPTHCSGDTRRYGLGVRASQLADTHAVAVQGSVRTVFENFLRATHANDWHWILGRWERPLARLGTTEQNHSVIAIQWNPTMSDASETSRPRVEPTENGPYLVEGLTSLSNSKGEKLETKEKAWALAVMEGKLARSWEPRWT